MSFDFLEEPSEEGDIGLHAFAFCFKLKAFDMKLLCSVVV